MNARARINPPTDRETLAGEAQYLRECLAAEQIEGLDASLECTETDNRENAWTIDVVAPASVDRDRTARYLLAALGRVQSRIRAAYIDKYGERL